MHPLLLQPPRSLPVLDPAFRPSVLGNRAFRAAVAGEKRSVPVAVAVERNDGAVAVRRVQVLPASHRDSAANLPFLDRLVKTLLWQYGGFRVVVGGPLDLGEAVRERFAAVPLTFDAKLMADVYERPFEVEATDVSRVPAPCEPPGQPRGRHLKGCRIGFDAGASDRKVAAVMDGEVVFSEEVPWSPSKEKDPRFHYEGIADAFRQAARRMPRVDAIGVSAAGVYINNRVMAGSLFRSVPRDLFLSRVRDLFLDLQREWNGVPMEVANDGEVAALAGSMDLDDSRVLGIALGSSEAGGYVTPEGNITTWLNELAFSTIDFSPAAPVDEWSGDRGCGGDYFSQKAAIRLARAAGIELDPARTPAEQLKAIQALMEKGDPRARQLFESIGCYLGYGLAEYAESYDVKHVMLMGRVVSGQGGNLILDVARRVLREEFPAVAAAVQVHLPGEASRRVGQAVAAASLPWLA